MPEYLEKQVDGLLRERDREDVLTAMEHYSWKCRALGMTREQIQEEFAALVVRIMLRLSR